MGSHLKEIHSRLCYIIFSAFLSLSVMAAPVKVPVELLSGLSSDQFEERKMASEKLKVWALKHKTTSPEALFDVSKTHHDPEVEARCQVIMKDAFFARDPARAAGFIGVKIQGVILPGESKKLGVQVSVVMPGLAGEKFGLMVGDVVLQIDDVDFTKMKLVDRPGPPVQVIGQDPRALIARDAFIIYVKSKFEGDDVNLNILRQGKVINKKLTLVSSSSSKQKLNKIKEEAFGKWLEGMKG